IKYVYAIINKFNTDKIRIISNLPTDLVSDYLIRKKQNIDPVVINALRRVTAFNWDDDLEINSNWKMKKIFTPIKPYGINRGYAFVLHDHQNNLALLSLYIDEGKVKEVSELITKHKDALQMLLINTHQSLMNKYSNEKGENIKLTSRESEILFWCTTGKTYPEISQVLCISLSTVKFHTRKIVEKLGVRNIRQAVSLAAELNLIILYPRG
ncbi:LuxR family transcriptional regulator, partial [Pantoea sp. BAV 3049]|uniref:helix-turn-helix transcriptional regulator n=1 Tax=Pantoea sp. BAV 3049 TaxID=2654188 RepID=UPI0018EEDFAC